MNTIDERIVSMKFNNSDFEQKAQTSLSTLEKLKSAFKMDGATKGLDNISRAASNVSLAGLNGAVETVGSRFKAMEVIAITALANITNSAINAGKRMLESLTIAPVKEGFSEYELKMNSVQTIMAGTGESLNTVMNKLNELNTYADKTIYSFSDMTTNIGKFTNAGVSLDQSVAAIQGVANVAAVSGANANEASRAMYNFAQALSAGYVKLIDWKSIENANMATVEFKNELINTAVAAGTLKDNMDGTYTVLTSGANGGFKEAISATQNFNDSLSAQWMTTEVLTETLGRYADETTDIGKKAFAAAQDVKTFSQLMDTLKEAVGSGWATTWEIVFGNFDEAKKLWTDVNNVMSGFIDNSAKARNDLLQLWKVAGGRTKLLASFKNIFNGILSVVKPINEAFREIFPPMTAKRLVALTTRFQKFTRQLWLSKSTMQSIYDVFITFFNGLSFFTANIGEIFNYITHRLSEAFSDKGNIESFFDILKGGASIVELVGKAFYFLYPYITGVIDVLISFGEVLLSVGGFIGRFVQHITGMFDVFSNVDSGIWGIFNVIVDQILSFFDAVKTVFESFAQIETKPIQDLSDKTQDAFSPMLVLFQALEEVLSSVGNLIKKAISTIGKVLSSMFNSIADAMDNASLERVLGIITSGGLIKILLDVDALINKLTGGVGDFSGMFKSVSGVLDAVRSSLELWQQNLKSKVLLNIAAAIGIIALSLVMLSGLDAGQVATSLAGVAGVMLILMNAMGRWTSLMGPKKAKAMLASSVALITMASAIFIMAAALKKVGELKVTEILKGIVAIAALSVIMVKVADALSRNTGKMMKGLSGMILFAITLRMLVKPIQELSELSVGQLAKGLGAIFILVSTLGAFLNRADFGGGGASAGAGLLLLAGAIHILASAVEKLGNLKVGQLAKGVGSIMILLASLAAFTKVVSGEKILATSVGLLIVAGALKILSKVVQDLGGKGFKELAKGVGAVAITLLSLALAAKVASGSAGGAVAIYILANALLVLFPVLYGFSKMSLGQIIKSLGMLAGTFAVLGVSAALLAPAVPVLLGLGAALLLIGAGVFAAGAGIAMLAGGLATLAAAGIGASAAFILAIEAIIESIPRLIAGIAIGLLESAADLITALVTLGSTILTSIKTLAPQVVETALFLLDEFLKSLLEYGPSIVETGYQLLIMFMEGLRDHIPEIGQLAVDIILELINTFSENMERIVQAGMDLALSFINGLADGIRNNAEPFKEALMNLIDAGIDALITFATPSGKITEVGGGIVSGIIEGLGDGPGALFEAMFGLGESIFEGICSYLGIASPSTKMITVGEDTIQGLINGLGQKANDVINKIGSIAMSIINKARSLLSITALLSAGMNLIQGLINGIKNLAETAKTAVGTLVQGVIDKAKSLISLQTLFALGATLIQGFLNGINSVSIAGVMQSKIAEAKAMIESRSGFDINSPSKYMIGIGESVMEGWAMGLANKAYQPLNALEATTDVMLQSTRSALSQARDILNSEIDPTLTIRPVMDMSNVYSSVDDLNSMMTADRSLELAGRTSLGMSSMAKLNQNGLRTNNTDVVSAIGSLRSDVAELQSTIRGLKMVLDTGALVGGVADTMDEALGFKAVLAGRGV